MKKLALVLGLAALFTTSYANEATEKDQAAMNAAIAMAENTTLSLGDLATATHQRDWHPVTEQYESGTMSVLLRAVSMNSQMGFEALTQHVTPEQLRPFQSLVANAGNKEGDLSASMEYRAVLGENATLKSYKSERCTANQMPCVKHTAVFEDNKTKEVIEHQKFYFFNPKTNNVYMFQMSGMKSTGEQALKGMEALVNLVMTRDIKTQTEPNQAPATQQEKNAAKYQ